MLGPRKVRCLDRLAPVSLETLVPPDHCSRHLDAKLDLSFVRGWVEDCYAANGRPSLDPIVFFKLQLVMFFEGVRSERQLMQVCLDRLSVRWYLGYALDEPLPDHSSLTRIRRRYGMGVFRRCFEHVVTLCQEAGIVWGKELCFDATKVRANASVDSLRARLHAVAQERLDELFAEDPAALADPRFGPGAGASDGTASGDPERAARSGSPPQNTARARLSRPNTR